MTDPDREPRAGGESEEERFPGDDPLVSALGLVGIALVTLLAAGGRLIDLDRYPGGLHTDEARHGLLARQAADSGLRWLIDGATDLSTILAGVVAIVGSADQFDVTAPRIAAALCGAGSVLFTGLWLRRELGALWGLAGAAVIAGSFWHILFSRLALDPIAGALALAASIWCLSEAVSRRGQAALPWYALTGIAVGLGFLSTPSLRLVPLALLGILGVTLYRWWEGNGQAEPRNWLLASAATWIAIGPYLISHRDDLGRWTPWSEAAGLPGAEPANPLTLPGALITSASTLVLPGEADPGLNLPGDAYLSLLLVPWAVIGLIGLFSASNKPASRDRFIVGGVLLLAVAIGVSAIDAGHPGQLVVLSPVIAGLVVYGFRTAVLWARMRTVRYALVVLIIVGIAGDAAWSIDRYVEDWSVAPATREAFNYSTVAALAEIERLDDSGPIFLSTANREELLAYLLTPARRHTFDGSRILPFPADEDGYLLVPREQPLHPSLEGLLDQIPELNPARDDNGVRILRLDDRLRERMPLSAPTVPYGDGLVLQGSDLRVGSEEATADVLVAWRTPAGSARYRIDLRLQSIETDDNSATEVELPANPLGTGLYQVLVAELEIPETGAEFDLEIRVRDEDGEIVGPPDVSADGYLLLNRYQFED